MYIYIFINKEEGKVYKFFRRIKVSDNNLKEPSRLYTVILNTTKYISLVLAFTMILTAIPFNNFIAFANQNNNVYEEIIDLNESQFMADVPLDYELNEKRDKYTKHFKKIDGTYEELIYDEVVHFYDGEE